MSPMPSGFSADDTIRLAVITVGHVYEVPPFCQLFYDMSDIVPFPQHMENFVFDAAKVVDSYDVVSFFHMLMEDPDGELTEKQQDMFDQLEKRGDNLEQGIVVLHHAILAWPKWRFWSDLVGIDDRRFDYHLNQKLQVDVLDSEHPIVSGLEVCWPLEDETYSMEKPESANGNRLLLGTRHDPSMRVLAWT